MGGVVGLDMPALLLLSDAFGYEKEVMARLLAAAESGVVDGIAEAQDNNGTM